MSRTLYHWDEHPRVYKTIFAHRQITEFALATLEPLKTWVSYSKQIHLLGCSNFGHCLMFGHFKSELALENPPLNPHCRSFPNKNTTYNFLQPAMFHFSPLHLPQKGVFHPSPSSQTAPKVLPGASSVLRPTGSGNRLRQRGHWGGEATLQPLGAAVTEMGRWYQPKLGDFSDKHGGFEPKKYGNVN